MGFGRNDYFTGNLSDSELGYYKELRRKYIVRLFFTYLAPLIILSVYFYFQYHSIIDESKKLHLKAIAENQVNTLELFFSERFVNLANLIDDPRFPLPPTSNSLQAALTKLKSDSPAFVDVGYFDSSGIQVAYAGPYTSLEKRDYSDEEWYRLLKNENKGYIITDIYPGFRQKLHFTMAVSRIIGGRYAVLRATLDPGEIYSYISSMEGAPEVHTSIINKAGRYQLVTAKSETTFKEYSIIPPNTQKLGVGEAHIDDQPITYAFAWLRTTDWALIVYDPSSHNKGLFSGGMGVSIIGISALMIMLGLLMIIYRANKLVQFQVESDRTKAQLEHAAKLASVGELAAGIAHEINNPLAIINEEAGLMNDLISLRPDKQLKCDELVPHIENIQETVIRCRNITRKLLTFVRKTDMELRLFNVNYLIDGVVDGLLGPEIDVSRIKITRNYNRDIPQLLLEGNQFQQVVLNIINNAKDAIGENSGMIAIVTSLANDCVEISINDSGKGIPPENLNKMFLPFFTTKEVGKGTGLGLSVSYGIIKSFGGKIEVENTPGSGATFKIILPIK